MRIMIRDIPYIIVDNQRLAPIQPVSRPDSAGAGRQHRSDLPFGIVDRVTISREALKKNLQDLASFAAEPSVSMPYSPKATIDKLPLLADSPKPGG
jgi:hypothetical protein